MLRSSRLLLLASLCAVAAVPVAQAEPPAPPNPSPIVAPQKSPDMAVVLARDSFPVLIMFTSKDSADVVDHADVRSGAWRPATQRAIQNAAFDKAFADTLRARDFSDGTFAGAMLDSLVSFAGPENVIESVKSYRPKPEQYRLLLRAIRDRTPTADPGFRNRSS